MMSPKKPTCLTLYQKALIIQELKTGASVTKLSKKYEVAKSTICKIKNNEEVILSAVSNTCIGPGKRTLRECKHPEMEKKLYEWFLSERQKSVMVSVDMIKEKAKALHSDMNNVNDEFSASDGWLQRFKKRFGIRYLRNKGEKLSTSFQLITDVINWNVVDTPVENIDDDENGNQSEETEGTEENSKKTVTPDSVINALNTTIQWAEESGVDYKYIQSLNDLMEKAVMQRTINNKSQTKITDYF